MLIKLKLFSYNRQILKKSLDETLYLSAIIGIIFISLFDKSKRIYRKIKYSRCSKFDSTTDKERKRITQYKKRIRTMPNEAKIKELAIIGTTASGKTALSLELAEKTNSIILSLDSLCVYKHIDIVSAKPSKQERRDIVHFGIDEVYPNENFDVIEFVNLYKKAKKFAINSNKNLIIVGGTGFYLKALKDGLSFGINTKVKLDINTNEAYDLLYSLDEEYMKKISKNDRYRIEKAYSIYKQSSLTPSQFFSRYKKESFCKDLKIFEILWEKEELRQRIKLRTKNMINDGLIDEIIYLEKKYSRLPNCMSSIGIVETLDYLDGKLNKKELEEKIITNTMKLAKRQNTFNKGQFENKTSNTLDKLSSEIIKYFSI